MLHYETRTDTWYLNGHAVDPYEDFAAILQASEEPTAIEDQKELRTESERLRTEPTTSCIAPSSERP